MFTANTVRIFQCTFDTVIQKLLEQFERESKGKNPNCIGSELQPIRLTRDKLQRSCTIKAENHALHFPSSNWRANSFAISLSILCPGGFISAPNSHSILPANYHSFIIVLCSLDFFHCYSNVKGFIPAVVPDFAVVSLELPSNTSRAASFWRIGSD